MLGSGWSVRGASSIARCAASRPIDGVDGSITFTPGDKLCLDGQRLIQTDANGVPVNGAVSNPGPANPFQTDDSLGGTDMVREYRTEKDSFARIRAYGALNGTPANGPAYFKVWTKGGQVHEYGVLSNAMSNAVVAAHGKAVGVVWAVSRISDRLGNYIDFNYDQREVAWGSGWKGGAPGAGPTPGREWVLKEILYTGHGTQAPANKVAFDYADAPAIDGVIVDGSEAYHLGSKVVALRRLESISTYVNGAKPVRVTRYMFGYDNSGFSRRSRLAKITECAGPTDGKCLPPVTFGYAAGGGTAYQRDARFAETMADAELQGPEVGILTGNFTGAGRTDILRWANDPANNRLYRSLGDGGFEQLAAGSAPGQFNLTGQQLSKTDGCYVATAADFNGDGVTDILRTMAAGADHPSCGVPRTLLFLANGDGTFQTREVTGIDFAQVMAKVEDHYACTDGLMAARATKAPAAAPRAAAAGTSSLSRVSTSQSCDSTEYTGTSRTEGKNYALLDVNRDGRMDVVTSVYPGFDQTAVLPTDAELCAGQVCTRVFLGQGDGSFVEKTDTNVAQRSLYGDPGTRRLGARMPLVSGDLNGDGNTDLTGSSGAWLSRGDGNFDNAADENLTPRCDFPHDFNGDGRPDCLSPHWIPALNTVTFSDGNLGMLRSSNFNLTKPGDELATQAVAGKPDTLGVDMADFDGDGRADILRWSDDPARNTLYLSNGDGSFRVAPFNLNNATDLLRKSDGKLGYLLGDFTGHGEVEILRLSSDHAPDPARSNALFVKADHTPADQLLWVRTGTGMKTDLTWVPLTNSSSGMIGARYFTDAGGPAKSSYPVQDLLLPLYVVATVTADTGDGKSRLATEYVYAGLRAAHDGRGWLGFREMRRQSQTPDGNLMTVLTAFVQDSFNTGVTQLTRTWLGAIRAVDPIVLSNTFNIYCDRTANPDVIAGASTVQSCPTTARLRKPYLHSSRADGWDINGVPLPTVYTVNTFNDSGDPTRIAVSTQGNAAGMAQNFTKTTDNEYYPDNTADDNWLVGRLKKAVVTGDNRVTPSAQASAARGAAARSLAAAAADVAKVDVITVRDIAAKFGTAAGWSRDSGAAITNSPGSAPYAKATVGQVVTVDITGTKKVYGTKAGTLSTLLTASITGGMTKPLQYAWTRVSGDRFTVSSNALGQAAISATLAVGENLTERWNLTVTDAKGVTVSDSTYITLAVSAGPLVVTVTPTPLVVNAPDAGRVAGSVQVQVTGGIKPYTYSWMGDTSGPILDIDDSGS
ncbi:MAG TPA: VCBS repeat-containing protein, partial [Mycobacterium sp.]